MQALLLLICMQKLPFRSSSYEVATWPPAADMDCMLGKQST
jgi:hypothetical protein